MSDNVARSEHSASDGVDGSGGGDGDGSGDGDGGGDVYVAGDGGDYNSEWGQHREEVSLRRKSTDEDTRFGADSHQNRNTNKNINKNTDITRDIVANSRERVSDDLSKSEVRTLSVLWSNVTRF